MRRELLTGLVRKDLRVKYQGSVLGFAWSLANPLLTLAVYSLVFGVVFKSGIPQFGFYLMCGLLLWNAFSAAVSAACGSVVGNAGLVKKVPFPLAVLPMSSVAFALVHFFLQLAVLVIVMAAFGRSSHWDAGLLLGIPAIALAVLFTLAMSFLVAALNVRYRDTQHIVEVVLLAGMWANPIVYSIMQIKDKLVHHGLWGAYFFNPITDAILGLQRALYGNVTQSDGQPVLPDPGYAFYLEKMGIGAGVSVVILFLTYRLYRRMSAGFAEEL